MSNRSTMASPLLAALALMAGAATGCTTSAENRAAGGDPAAQFLTETAHDSTSELELSRIAMDKAQDPRVKQYAQMIVQDHQRANQELAQLGKAKGVNVPDRPDELHGKTATYLNQLSGPQFDQEYMSCMVADHAKILSKFQDKAARAQDPQVRAWAQSQIPSLQMHLDQAREINRGLGGGSTLTAGATATTGAGGRTGMGMPAGSGTGTHSMPGGGTGTGGMPR